MARTTIGGPKAYPPSVLFTPGCRRHRRPLLERERQIAPFG